MTDMRNRGTAVITGASSGIGAVYADRLSRRGYDLILVARDRDRLDKLAARLGSETGRSIAVMAADLTVDADIHAVEEVLRSNTNITALVNSAGFGATAPLLQSDPKRMDDMIALNVVSLTRLTRAVAAGFVERGSGTIINISSISALWPEALNGVYGGTKAFVLAFSQSLHHELSDKGVQVQVILPGVTSTEFWNIAGQPLSNLPDKMIMSAFDMVDASLSALDQGELVTIPSLPDIADWDAFEGARKALVPNLSHSRPADRLLPNVAA